MYQGSSQSLGMMLWCGRSWCSKISDSLYYYAGKGPSQGVARRLYETIQCGDDHKEVEDIRLAQWKETKNNGIKYELVWSEATTEEE